MLVSTVLVAPTFGAPAGDGEDASRYPDEPQPLLLDQFPDRPAPLLELGAPFLDTGTLDPGIELPTGAVWQPSLMVFGTYRSAFQTFHDGRSETTFTEWANRLDLFANLQLSGTERILVGMRPLDRGTRFSGYYFNPDEADINEGWHGELNAEITTLFFEGDFGEIFPNIDPDDSVPLDFGFSIGRQPLFYQEGILINDTIDAIGVTKNNIFPKGFSNLQLTFLYGWAEINRDDNDRKANQHLFGFFTEADLGGSTLNLDMVYVYDASGRERNQSSFHWGASAVQRIGYVNTSFRAFGSYTADEDTAAASEGHLLFGEISWIPFGTKDNMYINGFVGFDEFSSAARAEDTGGPLGRTGILFAAVGIGRYGAPLGNSADDSWGAAIGYQKFFGTFKRTQIVVEAGLRDGLSDDEPFSAALGASFQQALGQRTVFRVDTFIAGGEEREPSYGARAEILVQF
ncbi:MAG: hypothetical protein Tsb0013_08240 [Phycisphaerales bacterium]